MQTSHMNAAVFLGLQQIAVKEVPLPQVIPGSVLIKVHACAVCGSDLRIFRSGNERVVPPRIIGHEVAGEIVDVGSEITNFRVGERVSIGADVPCGECSFCRSGHGNCCDINYAMGYQFDGGFAEYMLLNPLVVQHGPVQTFPATLDYEHAALAEPLACCLNGYEQALMAPGKTVVILGAGPIGMMLALLGQVHKASRVILFDPNHKRLQQAQKMIPGLEVIPADNSDPVAAVKELTGGQGAEVIFTACSDVTTHEQAIQMVARRGVVNLFGGLPKGSQPISVESNFLHYREAYVTGSHGSTPKQHKQALQMIATQQIDLRPLVTKRFSLQNIAAALTSAASGQELKVVIKPHD